MSDKHPEGWKEPVNQALVRVDQLFGCPPFTQWHWLAWGLCAVVTHAVLKSLLPGCVLQALLMWATQLDPEWPDLVRALVYDSEEVDL